MGSGCFNWRAAITPYVLNLSSYIFYGHICHHFLLFVMSPSDITSGSIPSSPIHFRSHPFWFYSFSVLSLLIRSNSLFSDSIRFLPFWFHPFWDSHFSIYRGTIFWGKSEISSQNIERWILRHIIIVIFNPSLLPNRNNTFIRSTSWTRIRFILG